MQGQKQQTLLTAWKHASRTSKKVYVYTGENGEYVIDENAPAIMAWSRGEVLVVEPAGTYTSIEQEKMNAFR